jgi:beta-phosphoglucomutase family hydrolase
MSDGRLKAVLWDMDGVIADTVTYHYKAWRAAFAKKGADFTMEEFISYFGQRHDTIIKGTLGEDIPPEEITAINEEKQADYRGRVAGHVRAIPGAVALVRSLKEQDIKQAITSSSPLANIMIIIRELDIEECFRALVEGTEVPEGKPSPQIYLLAAEKLGVRPTDCVVMEDAMAGVDGAKRAGMKCIAVTSSHPGSKLRKADLVVSTLESVSVADLAALFRPVAEKN